MGVPFGLVGMGDALRSRAGCRRERPMISLLDILGFAPSFHERPAHGRKSGGAKGTPQPRRGVTRRRWPRKNSFAEAGTQGGQASSSLVRKAHHLNGKGQANHEA